VAATQIRKAAAGQQRQGVKSRHEQSSERASKLKGTSNEATVGTPPRRPHNFPFTSAYTEGTAVDIPMTCGTRDLVSWAGESYLQLPESHGFSCDTP
jgi:hypothetical protein